MIIEDAVLIDFVSNELCSTLHIMLQQNPELISLLVLVPLLNYSLLMRKRGMDDRILKYIRGDSSDQTMDVYTRVNRGEAREQYLDCIAKLGL